MYNNSFHFVLKDFVTAVHSEMVDGWNFAVKKLAETDKSTVYSQYNQKKRANKNDKYREEDFGTKFALYDKCRLKPA